MWWFGSAVLLLYFEVYSRLIFFIWVSNFVTVDYRGAFLGHVLEYSTSACETGLNLF